MGEPLPPGLPPLSLPEEWELKHLREIGVPAEKLAGLLHWRRAVRSVGGQPGGTGTESLKERLRWR